MPRSYTNLLYHIVYATKDRYPWLRPDVRGRVHEYLGGIIRGAGAVALAIGGTDDHVDLLIKARPDVSVADLVRTIKANSSAWIHDTFPEYEKFVWQDGYAAFSVSRSRVPAVRNYIAKQDEHHRRSSYRDELMRLFRAHGVEFDERFL